MRERLLICGPRDLEVSDDEIQEALDEFIDEPPCVVIHGGASGVDACADRWAKRCGIPVDPYEIPSSEWKRGGWVGPARNSRMLREGKPTLVVAFRDRWTKGTANMIEQAELKGVRVEVVDAIKEES